MNDWAVKLLSLGCRNYLRVVRRLQLHAWRIRRGQQRLVLRRNHELLPERGPGGNGQPAPQQLLASCVTVCVLCVCLTLGASDSACLTVRVSPIVPLSLHPSHCVSHGASRSHSDVSSWM